MKQLPSRCLFPILCLPWLLGCAGTPNLRENPDQFVELDGMFLHFDDRSDTWSLNLPCAAGSDRKIVGVSAYVLTSQGAIKLQAISSRRLDPARLEVQFEFAPDVPAVTLFFSLLREPLRLELAPQVTNKGEKSQRFARLRFSAAGKDSGIILPGPGGEVEFLFTTNGPPWHMSPEECSRLRAQVSYGTLCLWRDAAQPSAEGATADNTGHDRGGGWRRWHGHLAHDFSRARRPCRLGTPHVAGITAMFIPTMLRENSFTLTPRDGWDSTPALQVVADCAAQDQEISSEESMSGNSGFPSLVVFAHEDPAVALMYAGLLRHGGAEGREPQAPENPACGDRTSPQLSWCWSTTCCRRVTESDIVRNARFLRDLLRAPAGDPQRLAVEVGPGWETFEKGDERFPSGMPGLAMRIAALGCEPRIWVSAFALPVVNQDNVPASVLVGSDGKPLVIECSAVDSSPPNRFYLLDPRRPVVADSVKTTVVRLIGEWGYGNIRFDLRLLTAGVERLQREGVEETGIVLLAAVKNLRESLNAVAPGAPLLLAYCPAQASNTGACDSLISEIGGGRKWISGPWAHSFDEELLSAAYLSFRPPACADATVALSLDDPMTDAEAAIAVATADMVAGAIMLTGDVASLTPAKHAAIAGELPLRALAGARPVAAFPQSRLPAPMVVPQSADFTAGIPLAHWEFRSGDNVDWADEVEASPFWQKIKVPCFWEEKDSWLPLGDRWQQGERRYWQYDGYAWYRTSVEIPKEWQGLTVSFELGSVADVDSLYVNGRKVDGTGEFPPQFCSAAAVFRRYTVKVGDILRPGERNFLHLRVYDAGGEGGMYSLATRHLPAVWLKRTIIRDEHSPKSATTRTGGAVLVVINSDIFSRDITVPLADIGIETGADSVRAVDVFDGSLRGTVKDGSIRFRVAPRSVVAARVDE